MPGAIFNVGWLPSNAQRPYPLADFASGWDVSGTFRLPDDFLVELVLPVPSGLPVDTGHFHIVSVASYPAGVQLTVGYTDSGEAVPVAVAQIPLTGHTEFRSYPLIGIGAFGDVIGLVTIGVFLSLREQPAGLFTFNPTGGQLVASAIRPIPRNVRAIRTNVGGELSDWFTGHIELASGSNFQITPTRQLDGSLELRFDAISGAGLNDDCGCASAPGPPILTINQMGPDSNGDFKLTGNACINITTGQGRISVRDTCSEPCCGCAEAEVLGKELATFRDVREELRGFVLRMTAQVESFSNTVLASRLTDQGCPP
jgi:hypothetical protein